MLDVKEIFDYLPHRYPFLLVDRVTEFESGVSLKAYKNVTYNEPQFTGHFPDNPIMPGVMIIEAMAQCTGILAFKSQGVKPDGQSMYYLAAVDNCRFRKPAVPGDKLEFEVKALTNKKGIWKFQCETRVEGKVIAACDMMCAERDV
ncbi:3-hydroxyacyl-ACP dehydratase FabZ [Thiomicrospira sp. WB1]|uniref:3-hydroxyacyl-ACP dehydratase FabZ n=1 Tax=Thiomicrospira sp. WB1 TaxID=1685380 RepID=UPI000749D3E3|nr:3-hydroxyacyl-ACP dehydratase FabZ [Thiomicrospira sp. WB1]KUJ72229.1 3-hydroxyacyl-[acyl-carrier-protein] dehydratase FabZ [Thiomicrospira sp. WB1]